MAKVVHCHKAARVQVPHSLYMGCVCCGETPGSRRVRQVEHLSTMTSEKSYYTTILKECKESREAGDERPLQEVPG